MKAIKAPLHWKITNHQSIIDERERELLDAMHIDDIRLIIKFTIWAFLREHANMIAKYIHERQKYQRTHVYKSTLVRPSINIQHKFVSENFNHPFFSKISSCMSIKTCSDWFGACFIFETPFKFKRHTRKTMYSISFYVLSVQQIQRLCEGVQMEGSVRLVIKTREEFQKESYNKSPQETCQSALEHPFYWIYKGWWWWWWGYHVRSKCDLLYDK